MIERTKRALARCHDCHKGFRIPNPDRTYKCKACGGTVHAVPEEELRPQRVGSQAKCPLCGARNAAEARFCSSCDGVLAPEAPKAPDEHDEEAHALSVRARQDATAELRRGHRWIGAITWLYRLGALALGLATAGAIVALARTEVPLQQGVLVVGLLTLLTVLLLMGALVILFRPFVWTLVVASLTTVVAIVHLVGPNPLGLALPAAATLAALLWAALIPTLHFRRLVSAHLDQFILYHSSLRTRRLLATHAAEERHDRLLAVMRNAGRHAWKLSATIGGIFVLASAFGTRIVLTSVRPQDPIVVFDAFEAAWNGGDLDSIGAMYPAEARAAKTEWLTGMVESHDWQAAMPNLADRTVAEKSNGKWVEYQSGDVSIRANWMLEEDLMWYLVRIEMPIPPLEPVLAKFREAWERSDTDAICLYFPPDHQERMRASIEKSSERRGWSSLPEILKMTRSDESEKESIVLWTVADGDVTTKWLMRQSGRWGLNSFQFPKR